MEELLLTIVKALVDHKDKVSVSIDPPNKGGVVVYHVKVAQSDTGRAIGKSGKIVKAIRAIVRSEAARQGQRVYVRID